MTKEEKIELVKTMGKEDLLEYFARYASQNILEMEESKRETYTIVKEEILSRMSR